jgi:hypothetical protein
METVTHEQLAAAERYLRDKNAPEDRWLLETGVQWFKVTDIEGKLFGMSSDAIAGAAARGEVPGAVLPSKQTGWRLPWSGLAYYIAKQRRAQERAAG